MTGQLVFGGLEAETVGRVFSFGMVLRAADLLPLNEDGYWEKPWKWEPEYQAWIAAGSPEAPEGGEEESPAWADFVRRANNP
jgi:hypothetical protein